MTVLRNRHPLGRFVSSFSAKLHRLNYELLELASGGSIDRIENLLCLQGHASPRQIRLLFTQQTMKRIEHVDLLAWRMPRIIFCNLKPLAATMHVEIANIGSELRLY